MAQSVIGALRVNLGLDSAQFEQGLGRTRKKIADMRKQFAAIAAAAAAAAVGLSTLTVATAKTANEITRLSQLANTAPADLQRWAAGAKTVGIEQQQLGDILKDVNDRIGDYAATGAGPMVDFFENIAPKVGVTADQFRKLSGPQALQLYVSSLEKAGASQQDMTFYLEALSSDATALLPLLRNNGAEMQRLAGNADSLGAVMDARTVAVLNRAHLALQDVGLAMQGLGNRIAGALAPGLTVLATGFADAMREGGWLRQVTDVLIDNLGRLATYVAAATAWFGIRYVGALVAARIKTLTLKGAIEGLRGALVRSGIGAVIVLAGELAHRFGVLAQAAGGFGAAFALVQKVAYQSFQNIDKFSFALWKSLQGTANSIAASFINSFADIVGAWDDVITYFTDMGVPRWLFTFRKEGSGLANSLRGIGSDLENISSDNFADAAKGFNAAAPALADIDALVAQLGATATDTADTAGLLNDAFNVDDVGDGLPINDGETGKGGGSGKSAAANKAAQEAQKRAQVLKDLRAEHDKLRATINMTDLQAKIWNDTQEAGTTATSAQGQEIARLNTAIDDMTQAKDRASQMADTLKRSAGSAFSSIVTGASSAKDAIASLAQSLAGMFADQAFNSIWGALAPSIPGAVPQVSLGSNASGTSNWRGGLTRVHELGGEIMNLPRGTQIIPHDISKRMADGAANGVANIRLFLDSKMLQAEILGTAGPVAVQLIEANNEQLTQTQRRA